MICICFIKKNNFISTEDKMEECVSNLALSVVLTNFSRLNCSSNLPTSAGITAALQHETWTKFDLSIFEILENDHEFLTALRCQQSCSKCQPMGWTSFVGNHFKTIQIYINCSYLAFQTSSHYILVQPDSCACRTGSKSDWWLWYFTTNFLFLLYI